MSENRKPDRRIARTRAALWAAIFELLQEYDWADINVQMICARADVARSSFYLHFDNKSALLDFGFDDVFNELEKSLLSERAKTGRLATIAWLVNHVGENERFFRRLYGASSNHGVFARFKATCEQVLIAEQAAARRDVTPQDAAFVIGGAFAVIERWITTGFSDSQSQIIERIEAAAEKVFYE